MHIFYLLSVWLHILAAAAWIGGMVALGAVLLPTLRDPAFEAVSRTLFYRMALRFRWVGWIMLALLVATGVVNLGYRGYTWADLGSGALWEGPFGQALAVKLGLVTLVLAISAVHDFYLGPKAIRAMREAPDTSRTQRLRTWTGWLGRLTLLLSLAILWYAVALVRGGV